MIDDEAIVCDANGLAVFKLLRRRWQCIPCPTRLRAAGRQEQGNRAFYLTQAMGGGKIHSLIAFGLPAADPALRSDSRVSYALRGGGRDLKMRAFTVIQKEAA